MARTQVQSELIATNAISGTIIADNAITATHIATLDKLKAKSPFARNIGLGQMDPKLAGLCGPSKVKYHAGAVAAWEEAGYKVADCAK